MKITGLFLFFILFLANMHYPINAEPFSMSNMGGMGNMGGGAGMLPMPSEEELKEIEKFLSTLSQEELDQLAQLGEEIIKKAEEEKVPLFFDQKPQQPAPGPIVQKKESKPFTPIKQPEPPKKIITLDVSDEVKNTLFRLIESINEIRLKASRDQELEDILSELDEQLNKFLYYLHVVNDKKVSVHLKDKEYADLYKKLTRLDEELYKLNDEFDVPNFKIMTRIQEKKYKRMLIKAEIVLHKIIKHFTTVFETQNIQSDLIKFIEKCEPDALKIKISLEQQEKNALEYSKKIPVTNTGKVNQLPHNYGSGGYDGGWNNPGGSQGYQPSGYNGRQQPIPGAFGHNTSFNPSGFPDETNQFSNKKSSKNSRTRLAGNENEEETDNEKEFQETKKSKSKHKESISDLEASLKNHIETIKGIINPHLASLNTFFTGYRAGAQPTDLLKTALADVNFVLRKLNQTSKKWHTQLTKEAKSASDLSIKTKAMSEFYDSAVMKPLRDLHETLQLIESGGIKLNDETKEFKKHLDDFKNKTKGNAVP